MPGVARERKKLSTLARCLHSARDHDEREVCFFHYYHHYFFFFCLVAYGAAPRALRGMHKPWLSLHKAHPLKGVLLTSNVGCVTSKPRRMNGSSLNTTSPALQHCSRERKGGHCSTSASPSLSSCPWSSKKGIIPRAPARANPARAGVAICHEPCEAPEDPVLPLSHRYGHRP